MIDIKFATQILSLSLECNPHKLGYQSVTDYFNAIGKDDADDDEAFDVLWISHESYIKACEKDELWVLTWYPDTPIGFYTLYADNLQDLLMEANKRFSDETKE